MTKSNPDKPLIHLFVHIEKMLIDKLRSALGVKQIHFGQARILSVLLHHDNLPQHTIADGLYIKPATVTNLVKKMEASGLIARRRDPNDDRVINVTLTPKGKEAASFSEKVIEQLENEIRTDFTLEEIETLRGPLERVRNNLGGSDPSI